MSDETTFNPVERMLKRKLDRGETLRQDEWDDWYEYHPELKPEEIVIEDDLVPEIDLTPRLEDDLQPVLDGIDILDAYARWSGKNFTPTVGSKRESIMIRCPNPAHNDANPSAWINLDKQTWYCGACAVGSDKYGIAAYNFGYDVPGFQGAVFPELRRAMVEACGRTVYRNGSGKFQLVPFVAEPEPEPEEQPIPTPLKLVVPEDPEFEDTRIFLDWEKLVESDTFLDHWMSAATEGNHLPHEFYWGEGLLALGLAVGNNCYLEDDPNVYFNMLVIILGGQSQGKTRTIRKLHTLLEEAVPFHHTGPPSTGVKWFKDPGSHQNLKEVFEQKRTNGSGADDYFPVRGCQYSYELENIIQATKVRSSHSSFIPVIEELFDETEGEVTHTVKEKSKITRAYHPFYCNITTTQPDYIHNFLSKEHTYSGFLSRWLVYAGLRRVAPISRPVAADLSQAVESLKAIHLWCATTPKVLTLTSDADNLWNEFFYDKLFPFTEKTNDAITGRFELYLKKFQGLFAVNEKSPVVEASHVQKSIDLWDYHLRTWRFFSGKIVADDIDACMNKIQQAINTEYQARKTGLSFNDLRQRVLGTGSHFTLEQLTRAFKIMVQFQSVKPYETTRTTKYLLPEHQIPEQKTVSRQRKPKTGESP